jgi:hypothetical protein
MPLLDPLRRVVTGGAMDSFQLMGEELTLVTGRELALAAERYHSELAALPAELRDRFEAEQRSLADEAHAWLRKYNRNVHTRLAGYLAVGFRMQFVYPWPVVAALGICQVMDGMVRSRVYGLIGAAAARLRADATTGFRLDAAAEAADDVLRRTNRGIFADSVPTVLYALRAAELERAGDPLGRALVDGPLPLLMDEESRQLMRDLGTGLAEREPGRRFAALTELTARHFDREQAVFTHHLGVTRAGARLERPSGWARRMTELREVPAPSVEMTRRGRRLRFRPYRLPADFDLRDHGTRVREFSRAFVTSVTRSLDDYRVAVGYVVRRFDRRGRSPATAYDQ